jgi:hypothetical protein
MMEPTTPIPGDLEAFIRRAVSAKGKARRRVSARLYEDQYQLLKHLEEAYEANISEILRALVDKEFSVTARQDG